MTTLFDHPLVLRNAVLRKGTAFALKPIALLERAGRISYEGAPPVIVNSLPKSGTHLLLQVARALPGTRYRGNFIATAPSLTLRQRTPEGLARRVRAILPSEALGAHLHHSATVATAMRAVNALHLFICRDPRDVLLSEIEYLTHMNRWHRMHRHFARLARAEHRLTLALDGYDDRFPDAVSRYLPYAGWLEDSATVGLRYEDLVGASQAASLARISAAHARRRGGALPQEDVMLARLAAAIRPEKSHTFREGGAQKWRRALSPAMAEALTDRLAPVLERFGYV